MSGDEIAETVQRHADRILKAAGSGLRYYTMPSVQKAILGAVMDCFEEAYRAGAKVRAAHESEQPR